jgi:hypothetical protein
MGGEDDDRRDDADSLAALGLSCNTVGRDTPAVRVEHWQISSGGWRSMHAAPGDVVVAHEGILWVTVEGDLSDYVLRPGEAMPLHAEALTFFGALNREVVRFSVRRHAHPIAKASDADRCGMLVPLSQRTARFNTPQDGETRARSLDPEFSDRP